jgi:hypothetical protein
VHKVPARTTQSGRHLLVHHQVNLHLILLLRRVVKHLLQQYQKSVTRLK